MKLVSASQLRVLARLGAAAPVQAANGPRIHQAIPDTTALLDARFASFGFGAAAANPSSGLVWCGEAVNTAAHTGGRTSLSVNTNDIAKTLDDGGWCDVEEDEEEGSSGAAKETMELTSVLKKRRKKMNRHKYKKWRKKMRTALRKLK